MVLQPRRRVGGRLMRILDGLYSLKMRLGVVIVAGVGSAVATVTLGRNFGIAWAPSALLGIIVALVLVQFLAHGTTSPLREMATAANAFRHGDYSQRVRTNARDEVGQLASSFNRMADELAEVDRTSCVPRSLSHAPSSRTWSTASSR
jgi:HAMP domain-containing protein